MCLSATVFMLDERMGENNHFLGEYPSLTPACAGIVERRGSELKTAKIYIQC